MRVFGFTESTLFLDFECLCCLLPLGKKLFCPGVIIVEMPGNRENKFDLIPRGVGKVPGKQSVERTKEKSLSFIHSSKVQVSKTPPTIAIISIDIPTQHIQR
jgi:hypothetical protein